VDETALRDAAARAVAAVGGRRRLVAAALVGLAVVAGLRAVTPEQSPTRTIWAAARDLAGGRPLTADDLRPVALPVAAVPAGALPAGSRVVGRLLAAPVRRGEPLTDVRLLEPPLLAALDQPGLVAVPVHVADGSAAAALVHAGDVVDILAAGDPSTGAEPGPVTVAAGVRVLSVPARVASTGDGSGLVVVAVTREQAGALARAGATTRLSLALVQS
jgi:pilus assembly protein CpaB